VRRAGALLFVAVLAAAGGAGAAEDEDARLEALRRAIEEHRERVTGFERRERGLLETVEEIDKALSALRQDAAAARGEAQDARARLAALEVEIGKLEESLVSTRAAMSVRAVALYKAGDLGPIRALFAAENLREALERAEVLQRLLTHDQRLLRRFRVEAEALGTARSSAQEASATLEAAADRLARRADEVEREQAARRQLLASVRSDRRRSRAALNELEAAAKALEETLAHLQDEPRDVPLPGGTAFAARRGQLEPPVEARVAETFGRVVDSEFQTETFRKGIEFRTEIGDAVYSVGDGLVRFAGWFRGYGKIVILDHGDDYFTVSGHLDEIEVAVGDRVREGDRIARAGETGSLLGPKLYFELRRGGQALDPADWLRGGRRR
jgi:septal ring factor EnvC (AmiA/AmiB activator)